MRVRVGGLREALERLVGTRQQHPAVGIVRMLLEALGEAVDHRHDLPLGHLVASPAVRGRGDDRGRGVAESLVEDERRRGNQQQQRDRRRPGALSARTRLRSRAAARPDVLGDPLRELGQRRVALRRRDRLRRRTRRRARASGRGTRRSPRLSVAGRDGGVARAQQRPQQRASVSATSRAAMDQKSSIGDVGKGDRGSARRAARRE